MNTTRKYSWISALALMLALVLLLISFSTTLAQSGYTISLHRDFGFGNGSQIRGTFSVTLNGADDNVSAVEFQIDGQKMTTLTQPPFKFQFNTNSYPSAVHKIGAVVTLKDGTTVSTETRSYQFASASEESAAMRSILVPLLSVVFGIILLGVIVQVLAGRGKPVGGPPPGTQRAYGFAGGSICPNCKRPTPLHPMGFNVIAGKLDRCENCGKWSVMRRVPIDLLRAAETAELKADQAAMPLVEKSDEEKLRDMLDESRYTKD